MHWCFWIYCVCLFSCYGEGTIRSDAQIVVGRVGESAVLGCSLLHQEVGRPPLYVIEWVRFGFMLPIFIKFGLYSPRVDPQYLGRARIEEGASLHIDSLRSEDQGWYECRVLFLDRHHSEEDFQNGTWVHLTVNSPPSFRETPPMYVEVRVGDTLTLTCVAYGNPQPVILWKRDDVILESRDGIQINNGSLRIVGVERSNAGMYTCHASSEEGEIMHTSRVLVQGPPTIVVPPENTTVNVSQDVFLTCQAEAYPANLTYSWFLGSTNVYLLSNLQSRVRILVDGSFLLQQATPEDAGKYTCIPSNGMWKSPSASAYLTVLHPAYVTDMPPETYLPIGMRGMIRCPARANPPLLSVNWTKDGVPLELEKFPGWYLEEEGSLVVTTANDDALGTYTCTPYNSYGTAGVSSPTQVVLKDPPSFTIIPKEEYFQDVGRELIIPCAASGDPPPVISWAKLGAPGRSAAQMDANSSLVFRPLTKDEHGTWECTAANNVARISARSAVYVLGTSPHTVSKVSAQPLVSAVNVSWIPGYDGGYFQRFSVWMKSTTRGHHEWLSIPAPADASHLLVQNLQADTVYQFSVLSQNKLGSGPFSEIVSSSPLSTPPTTLPPPVPTTDPQDILSAPCSLSANETALGVLLQWAPPLRSSLPLRGYGLEGRRDEGAWELLDESIPPSQTQILVPGLVKDALYEFRLVAFAGDYISNPSNSVNISTAGMKVYPSHTEHPDVQQKPLLAGVVGGACFLSLAVILGIVAACMMNRRRARRRQKRRQQDAPMVFSQPKNASPSQNTNGSGSPDSLMRIKLQVSPYESFRRCVQLGEKSGNVGTSHRNSTSGRYTIYESNVGESLPLERISRGPDGRFVVETETRPSRGSIRGFPYVTETDLYPEFNARDSSDLSLCSQAKSYLQVSQLPERAADPWREEVKMRPKATGQARKEARDSGYRQGKYFGCSSSPLDEAKPFRIPDISPVTSSVTLPYSKVEEARCGDPTHTKGELERTISTLRGSENDVYSALGGEAEAPSSLLQKPLGVSDQESQMRHSLSTQSGILQYLSLPFFKEMSVDGEWLAEDEQARTSESGSSGGTEQEATNALSMEDRTLMDVDGTSGARKEEIPCVPHTLFSLDYTNSKEQSVPVKSFLKPPEPNLGHTKAVLPGSLLWMHPPENTERLKVGQRAPWGLGEVPMDSRAEQPLSSHCKCPLKDQPFSVFTDFQVLEKQRPPVDRSLFLHGSEKVMRSSLTSQSSGRGSVSFLRPPSLAQSVGGSYLNSPFGETSSWHSGGGSQGSSAEDYRHRKDSPLATISNRRNTSVDENYEWDSDFNLEADLMDSLQVFRGSNSGPPISTIATGDVERQSMKLPLETGLSPAGSGSTDPMDCRHLQALSSPEERCAALKEEFMEYQRRRRAELKGHTRNKHYAGCYEQATLL
ncbi:protein turtle homolog A isoform X2 [Spea bombifrons]|uniref:protein turtle homolog A isoform X2 n=1 Tax=Spea bombifrons TaxID=233779 RepID=UPI00234A3FA6|nr:protein turtle homolog A isoform X2 [Spea bombifrons]